MIKLIYHQTRARAAPTWSHQPDADIAGLLRAENMADAALQPAVESVWNWLRSGSSASGGEGERLDAETAEALGAVLMQKQKDGDELIRVNACYRLQHATCAGLPQASDALLAVMDRGSEAGKRVAVQALGAAGEAVVPPLIQRVRDLAVHSDANLGENDEETIGRYFEAVCNSTTALGEAASDAKPSGWAGTAAAVDALLLCAAAVRAKSRNLDLAGPINPFEECSTVGKAGWLVRPACHGVPASISVGRPETADPDGRRRSGKRQCSGWAPVRLGSRVRRVVRLHRRMVQRLPLAVVWHLLGRRGFESAQLRLHGSARHGRGGLGPRTRIELWYAAHPHMVGSRCSAQPALWNACAAMALLRALGAVPNRPAAGFGGLRAGARAAAAPHGPAGLTAPRVPQIWPRRRCQPRATPLLTT